METIICNTSEAPRKAMQHSYTYYLDKIKELGIEREFATLKAFCTDGDIHQPFPYQWVAHSTMVPGDDDPFEGMGDSPLNALKDLYEGMKHAKDNPWTEEDEETTP